jgi:hypothetical protein
VKANILHQAWTKLWRATIVSERTLDKEDFAGFTVCNKDTFHEMMLMSENWTSQTLNVKSGMWNSGSMQIKGLKCQVLLLMKTLTFWHRNFILHTLYIKCKNAGPKKGKMMK